MVVPAQFVHNLRTAYGAAGEQWLTEVPARLERAAQRWNVTIDPPRTDLSVNYVAPATLADGTAIIFKMSPPFSSMVGREVAALRHYQGPGCVNLLAANISEGELLLERLLPGVQLTALTDDDQATEIIAAMMLRLRRPAPDTPHPFPSAADQAAQLGDLRATFAGNTGPYSPTLVGLAESLFRDLIASSGPPMLIHADLHHYNILSDGADWRAIDPHGVIAEAEYEVGAMLRNPNQTLQQLPDLDALMARRVALLSELLGFGRQRIAGWGVAYSMLSAWWDYTDDGTPNMHSQRCAAALARLL